MAGGTCLQRMHASRRFIAGMPIRESAVRRGSPPAGPSSPWPAIRLARQPERSEGSAVKPGPGNRSLAALGMTSTLLPSRARRRGQLAGVEHAIAVAVLAAEGGGEACAMLAAGNGLAAAAGQLGGDQHAVAVAIHGVEGVAEPVLVFGQRDAAIVVGVHARQVIAAALHLRLRAPRQAGQQAKARPSLAGLASCHRRAHRRVRRARPAANNP